MSKFQFSPEAYIEAVSILARGEPSCADKAFDLLAADVDKQQNTTRRKWHHLKRGSDYTEFCRGTLQVATKPVVEGDILICYQGETGDFYYREQGEFEDGRFVEII